MGSWVIKSCSQADLHLHTAWPKPLYFGPWRPDAASCNAPTTHHSTNRSKGPQECPRACPSEGGGGLQPSASCLRTCRVGSLGAGLATIQIIKSWMFFFWGVGVGGGGRNHNLSQMISGYGNGTLSLSSLFPAFFWSICEVFWGLQQWMASWVSSMTGHYTSFCVRL